MLTLSNPDFYLHLVFQDRGIGNTTLSTFGVAQAVLQIVLMLYPFSDPHPHPQPCPFLATAAWSAAKGDTVLPGLFTQYIVGLDTFWNTCSISARKNALNVKLKSLRIVMIIETFLFLD